VDQIAFETCKVVNNSITFCWIWSKLWTLKCLSYCGRDNNLWFPPFKRLFKNQINFETKHTITPPNTPSYQWKKTKSLQSRRTFRILRFRIKNQGYQDPLRKKKYSISLAKRLLNRKRRKIIRLLMINPHRYLTSNCLDSLLNLTISSWA